MGEPAKDPVRAKDRAGIREVLTERADFVFAPSVAKKSHTGEE